MDYRNYDRGYAEPTMSASDYMTRTYRWMACGLLITFCLLYTSIMGDVTKRRGRVLGMEPDEDGMQTVIAEVPLAELSNFTTFIRQITQGRGWFTTDFARYEILPEMLVPTVVEQAKKLGNLDESADD